MKEILVDTYEKSVTSAFQDAKPCKGNGFQIASSVIPSGSYVVIDGAYKIFVEPLTVYDIPIERSLEYYFPAFFNTVNFAVTGNVKFSNYSDPIKIVVFDETPTYIQKRNFLLTVNFQNLNTGDYLILNRLIGMPQIKLMAVSGNIDKFSFVVSQGLAPMLCNCDIGCVSHFSDLTASGSAFNTILFEHSSCFNELYAYWSKSNANGTLGFEFTENSHVDSSNKLYFEDSIAANELKSYLFPIPYKTLGIAFAFRTTQTPQTFALYRSIHGLSITIKSSASTFLEQNWYTLMDEQKILLEFRGNNSSPSTLRGLVCFKSYR